MPRTVAVPTLEARERMEYPMPCIIVLSPTLVAKLLLLVVPRMVLVPTLDDVALSRLPDDVIMSAVPIEDRKSAVANVPVDRSAWLRRWNCRCSWSTSSFNGAE